MSAQPRNDGSPPADEHQGVPVGERSIEAFVGRVEPGDEVSLRVILWTVGLSLLLLAAATIWWVSGH